VTCAEAEAIALDAVRSARPARVVAMERGALGREALDEVLRILTDEVIFELLLLTKGRFDFRAQTIEHDGPAAALLPAEQILMEGLRRVDEWRAFSSRLPSRDAVLDRTASFEPALEQLRRDQREPATRSIDRLVSVIDGRIPLGRAVDLSRLGTFEGARLIVRLLDAGAVAPSRRSRSVLGALRRPVAREAGQRAQQILASFVPLTLLALVAWGAGQPVDPSATPGVAVVERPFEQAVAAFETRRLRHAVEAYRHQGVGWPTTLDALQRSGWRSSGGLAAPSADTYYYAESAEGLLLLPPDLGTTR